MSNRDSSTIAVRICRRLGNTLTSTALAVTLAVLPIAYLLHLDELSRYVA